MFIEKVSKYTVKRCLNSANHPNLKMPEDENPIMSMIRLELFLNPIGDYCNVCGTKYIIEEQESSPSLYCSKCGEAVILPGSRFRPHCGEPRS